MEVGSFGEIEIKKEEVHESEYSNWTPSATGREGEDKKCGEILLSPHGNLTFVCVLCMESFVNLQSFGLHIQSKHLKVRTESNITDPSSFKTYPIVEERAHSFLTRRVETEAKVDRSPIIFDSQRLEHQESLDEPHNADNSDHIKDHQNEKIHPNYNTANKTIEKHEMSKLTAICKYCEENFPGKFELKEHLRTHTGPLRYICQFCPKKFANRALRQSHINSHTGERPHKCSYCPKAFANLSNLRSHESRHSQIKKHKCNYCDKTFVRPNQKKMHERTHTGEKPYPCPECGKRFRVSDKMKRHMTRHDNARKCTKEFETAGSVTCYTLVHSKDVKVESDLRVEESIPQNFEPSDPPTVGKALSFPVNEEAEGFSSVETELLSKNHQPTIDLHNFQNKTEPDNTDDSDHIEELYDDETDPGGKTIMLSEISKTNTQQSSPAASGTQNMICKYCDRIFLDMDKLKEHRYTHTGPKRFVCSFCPKTFRTRAMRQAHINIHTGERPYKCHFCPKAFAQSSNLQAHINIHTGDRSYKCSVCSKVFATTAGLNFHMSAHLQIKKYECSYCDKSFIQPTQKTMHERTHTGEKPYPCTQCGKRFRRTDTLKTHMFVHAKDVLL